MDYINNRGEKIGSLTVAIGKDTTVTINRLNDLTTVTTQDRTTGKFSSRRSLAIRPSASRRLERANCSFEHSALASFRMGMTGSASFQRASLAPDADARYADCFAGASAISATPTIMRAGTSPSRCPRSLAFWNACTDIMAA